MSFDLRIKQTCTHQVIEERHDLQPDGRTVRFIRPPSSIDDVTVKIYGRVILPSNPKFGYNFEEDELTLNGTPKLVFRRSVKLQDPLIELSYPVNSFNCRRCAGALVEYDPKPDDAGKMQEVRHEELLAQMIEKWQITLRGSNEFRPYIGTDILALVGAKDVSFYQVTNAKLAEQLRRMAILIQENQTAQLSYQEMSPRELLSRIEGLNVIPLPDNPLVVRVITQFSTVQGSIRQIEPRLKVDPASDFFKNVGKFSQ